MAAARQPWLLLGRGGAGVATKSLQRALQHWPGQPCRGAATADRQQSNGQGLSINTHQFGQGHLTGVSSVKCYDHQVR